MNFAGASSPAIRTVEKEKRTGQRKEEVGLTGIRERRRSENGSDAGGGFASRKSYGAVTLEREKKRRWFWVR